MDDLSPAFQTREAEAHSSTRPTFCIEHRNGELRGASVMRRLPISRIVVGDRHRRHLGNIGALAASIRELGLLHPVVVRPDGLLVAGERRLEACKLLGWKSIPATLVDLREIARGEFAENAMRKDFLPSEVEAIRRALEPLEKRAAQQRMRRGKAPSGKFPEGVTGQTRDKVGAFAGMSGRTVEKVAAVVRAAERDPRKFGALLEEMDRTRKVDGVYRKLRQAQDETRRLAVKPVDGRFRTIVVDPPYSYRQSLAGRARPDYAVMSQKQLLALPVVDWADGESHIYLWAPNNCLPEALELMSVWGFSFTTLLTWIKPRFGLGSYFRASTEQCLFGVRGKLMTRARNIPTHFEAAAGRHSDKPDEFFDLVERASYPRFLEVFARKHRKHWTAWGAGVSNCD
jgi:N6-adenosine-specific RNA methylase IME4